MMMRMMMRMRELSKALEMFIVHEMARSILINLAPFFYVTVAVGVVHILLIVCVWLR
jgi:hypothetical protein